ncbi:MAG: hypothetical protein J6B43_00865 [Lachnospiraceae bacterium]|nr:hypothetical protein [Lachnospiraceae bacterium]
MAEEYQAGRNAEGFLFLNAEDAGLAATERKQIAYLEAHLDYQNPEQVLAFYDKALQERIFKTPVGMIYLKQLQSFLLEQAGMDPTRVAMIPVYQPCTGGPEKKENPRIRAKQVLEEESRSLRLRLSVILNVLLVIAVISMFIMTLQSDRPNILNYRTAILNEYAAWEQELSEREQVIREKERELKLSGD